MLCVTLKKYTRVCAPTTGGVSRMWQFDPMDFDFATGTGVNSYDTITRRTGATAVGGASMFPVSFQVDEGTFKATQKTVGCSNSFDYELTLQLPQLNQDMFDFLNALAAAACCCGLGLLVELNDGTVLVLGERYVDASSIPRFIMKMDGTTLDSGKAFTDFNGGTLVLKGSYNRAPNTFTGGTAAIEAFEPTP